MDKLQNVRPRQFECYINLKYSYNYCDKDKSTNKVYL